MNIIVKPQNSAKYYSDVHAMEMTLRASPGPPIHTIANHAHAGIMPFTSCCFVPQLLPSLLKIAARQLILTLGELFLQAWVLSILRGSSTCRQSCELDLI